MKLKSFSREDKVLVVEDENAILHEMPFDFVDWLVRFLLGTGYIEIVQHKPDMMFTHKWTGRGIVSDTKYVAEGLQAKDLHLGRERGIKENLYDSLDTDDKSRFMHEVEAVTRELTALRFVDSESAVILLADANSQIADLQRMALLKTSIELHDIELGEKLRHE